MSTDEVVPVNDDDGSSEPESPKTPKPIRPIPTNRMAVPKQFDTLRAFGASSEPDRRAVTNVEASKLVGLHAGTVGLITPFFSEIGLLERTTEGWKPSPEVVEFARAYEWSPNSAAARLGPVIRKTWFAECLMPKLRYNPLTLDDAVSELAMSAKASPKYRSQLESLIDYLSVAGIVTMKDNQVRLTKPAPENGDIPAHSSPGPDIGHGERRDPPPHVMTLPSPAAGVVQFNVSVKVDMTEFAGWSPDRISAFFSGIAQVLAAKAKTEGG